jgi:hypothetical protein
MGIFDSLAKQIAVQVGAQAEAQLVGVATNVLQDLGFNVAGSSNFNVDDFRNNISAHNDLAKADKFNMVMMLPRAIQLAMGTQLRDLTFQCETSELPSRDINLIEFRHYGFIKRIPHQNQYGQASFTFICTGDMWEKRLFDAWLDVMVPVNSGLVTYPLDQNGNPQYMTSIYCNQYDTSGNPIYSVQLIDAMPTSISQLSQNWNDDSYHRLVVTFAFRKWLSDSTIAQVPPVDFGTATGRALVTPANPINNQTNNPGGLSVNLPILGTVTAPSPLSSPLGIDIGAAFKI